MDADGLPLVGPGIDYTKVGAIHPKRTLAFLNHFITHTVRFLNRFSCVCEDKLSALSLRIQRLETTMNVLEAKLSSIPGLENVTAPSSSSTGSQPSQPAASEPSASAQPSGPAASQPAPAAAASEVAVPEPEPAIPENTVSKDPRYMKYFKMVNMGVPEQAVKNKMRSEGADPNFLNTPNAPAPSPAAANDDDDDDEPDFSDSDHDNDSAHSFSD
ncbi:WASH complex subunit 3-like [Lineus longissimus]|uniref:WASH complex subunit 3-like n=1 Tax=Lineus longissimus TaxID=88925 RepID=UPI002B4E029C